MIAKELQKREIIFLNDVLVAVAVLWFLKLPNGVLEEEIKYFILFHC